MSCAEGTRKRGSKMKNLGRGFLASGGVVTQAERGRKEKGHFIGAAQGRAGEKRRGHLQRNYGDRRKGEVRKTAEIAQDAGEEKRILAWTAGVSNDRPVKLKNAVLIKNNVNEKEVYLRGKV